MACQAGKIIMTKTKKRKCDHANTYGMEMKNTYYWKMTQPRHPTRETIWEIDETKWKHTYSNLLHPRHRTRDSMWETKEETCKQTRCKVTHPKTSTKRHHAGDKCKMSRNESIVEQNDPAKGDKQRNNAEPLQNDPATATASSEKSGQGIQPSSH